MSVFGADWRRCRISRPVDTTAMTTTSESAIVCRIDMASMTRLAQIRKMRRALLAWFVANGRDLPWRKTSDPYQIVVSEIMLQQTQVDRVIPKYLMFLQQFPTWRALAKGTQAQVVKLWHGLGYNRRAMMLHRLAKEVGSGELPTAHDELVKLPAIGAYTAEAVRAFAFRAKGAAPVDTNIERILKRVFKAHDASRQEVQALAAEVVPKDVWSWGHAMMDLGATVCTARSPKCESCPLKTICASYPCEGNDVRKRPQEIFQGSDRMYRGRIVARLRGRAHDVDQLQQAIDLADEDRFGRIVDSLLREGLICLKNGKLALA